MKVLLNIALIITAQYFKLQKTSGVRFETGVNEVKI